MILTHLGVKEHALFGNLEFPLSHKDSFEGNYKTVIIGPNGTGKSTILSCIADAITIECSERKRRAVMSVKYDYELRSESWGEMFVLRKDDLTQQRSFLPGKLLVLSSTPNDRFPFLAKNSIRRTDKYEYLGMKSASNNIFFSSMKEKLLQDMCRICTSLPRVKAALEVLDELGLESKFSVSFEKGSNFSFFIDSLGRGKYGAASAQTAKQFQGALLANFLGGQFYRKNKRKIDAIVVPVSEKKNNLEFFADLRTIRRSRGKLDEFSYLSTLVEAKVLSIKSLGDF